jgi:hypothetical protein
MKCKEILKSALRLLNECGESDEDGDFAERSTYILSTMFSEAARLDKNYRASNGSGSQPPFSPIFTELDKDFPLCDRFASAAAFYLASMLIVDENDELSDTFYDKYCDSMSSISSELMGKSEKIKNVY